MREEELKNEDMKKFLSTLMEGLESQLDPYFFQEDNDVQKKPKTTTKYSNTKVKTRNLLTNVSYRRYRRCRKNKLCYRCFFVFNTEFKSNWS